MGKSEERDPLEIWRQELLHWKWIMIGLALVLGLSLVSASAFGPISISPVLFLKFLISKIPGLGGLVSHSFSDTNRIIIAQIRLPRVILGALVGAALGITGATVQGLFRNPLAEPYTVGVSAGAALGAVGVMAFGLNFVGLYTIPLVSFVTAVGAIFLVYHIAKVGGKVPVGTLLLAGITISLFFSAIVSLMLCTSGEKLHGMIFWLMGGLWLSSWTHVLMAAPLIVAGGAILYTYSRELNVLLLGGEQAKHLGIKVERLKKILLVLGAVVTAAAVAVSGIIGFVGLIVPHMMRILVGADHRILLPAAGLGGAIFLIWADVIARTAIAPVELPVGIITAMAGGPFFLYLLRRRKEYEFYGDVLG